MACVQGGLNRIVQAALVLAAAALLAFAWRCDEPWFDRHVFLPQQFFIAADRRIVLAARVVAAALAALLLLLVRYIPKGGAAGRLIVAVLLAAMAAEPLLQWKMRRLPRRELIDAMDALTSWDPRFGTTLRPSMDGLQPMAGRPIRWITDAERRRIPGAALDPALPSLVFTGESTVAGAGLQWDETFPALLGARLRLQVVNLASLNHRLDQSAARLKDDLPKLAQPTAVVGLFMPGLVGRGLSARQPQNILQRFGYYRLWRHLYWSEAELREGMLSVAASLREIVALAKARGSPCIFAVTGHTPLWMRRELFETPGLDHVVVEVPERDLLAEGHPGPQGSARLADALEQRLREKIAKR